MYCIDLHKWKAKLRRVMVEEVEKKKKRDKEKEVKSGRRRTDIGGRDKGVRCARAKPPRKSRQLENLLTMRKEGPRIVRLPALTLAHRTALTDIEVLDA
ncbi:hypothetical protein LTR37_012160 [Vermiconidia calcicola]|uniref:Uncharacterized protein n=1 Tax=Vermiconidia calcicola TaxID=1690605 RepID=A0ACC3N0L0_9PEZI|nr:hypothetical protein LTR37_012160 [Vermiconidia calcicola]